MNNSPIKKPLMLAGLIVNIVAFAIFAISCLISLVTFISMIAAISDGTADYTEGIIVLMIVLLLFMLAFCIAGIVVSAVGITRTKLEGNALAAKKGMVLASFVFDCILAILILISFASGFNVLSFIILLALIAAATLIMIDLSKKSPAKVENDMPQQVAGEEEKKEEVASEVQEEKKEE